MGWQNKFVTEEEDLGFVPDSYIVTLRPDATSTDFDDHVSWVSMVEVKRSDEPARAYSGVMSRFNLGSWNGYSGHFADSTVQQIRTHPAVERVERDYYVHAQSDSIEYDAPWGLSFLSARNMDADRLWTSFDTAHEYRFDGDSLALQQDMWAYVIDSGIRTTHEEFGGRAHAGWTAYPDRPNEDDFGHGTHVAGVIAGKRAGVCKKCNVIAVKVLDEKGVGTVEKVLKAIDWTVNNITSEGRAQKSVLNLSFGHNCKGKQDATCGMSLSDAIQGAYDSGVVSVVAAGNFHHLADDISPASTPEAVTVASINRMGQLSNFSAFGPYIDIAAPGELIWGATSKADDAYTLMSGTSAAAPHVSGLILYLKSTFPDVTRTAADAVEKVLSLARPGLLRMSKEASEAGTPNLLVHNGAR